MESVSAKQIAFVVLAAVFAAGCLEQTPSPAPSALPQIQFPSPAPAGGWLTPSPTAQAQNPKADAITENMLQALSAKNYTAFTANFSQRFKQALTQRIFNRLANIVFQTSGKYVSKQPPSYGSEGGFEAYSYLSDFEMDKVNVTVVFNSFTFEVDAVILDSPLLRLVKEEEQASKPSTP